MISKIEILKNIGAMAFCLFVAPAMIWLTVTA